MTERVGAVDAAVVEEFRGRLREARARLLAAVARTDEELQTLEAHQPGGPLEEVDKVTAADILSRLEGRERHALDEIREAQARLETGTFGVCGGCGHPIDLTRLRAMPATRHCLPCQAREEGKAR